MSDLTQFNNGAGFDGQAAQRQFSPLPPNEYGVQITDAGVHDNKNNPGCHIKLELTVLEGECKGRKVFWRMNVKNPNQVAEDRGKEDLAKLQSVLGIVSLTSTEQLQGGYVTAKVVVNGESTAVRGASAYEAPQQQAPPPFAPAPAPAAPPAQPAAWQGSAPPPDERF
jgi:hypothetical protein